MNSFFSKFEKLVPCPYFESMSFLADHCLHTNFYSKFMTEVMNCQYNHYKFEKILLTVLNICALRKINTIANNPFQISNCFYDISIFYNSCI
jgi:hypothetical protein